MIRNVKRTVIALAMALICIAASAQEASKPKPVKFAWGADFVGAIDLSGNDMSTIGLDAFFGIKMPAVSILGVGAGINISVATPYRQLPLFMIFRTSFSKRPQLCFLDLRGGVSVFDIRNGRNQTGAYVSAGLGVNLAASRKFRSSLSLSYTYFGRKDYIDNAGQEVKAPDLHGATVRLGISF